MGKFNRNRIMCWFSENVAGCPATFRCQVPIEKMRAGPGCRIRAARRWTRANGLPYTFDRHHTTADRQHDETAQASNEKWKYHLTFKPLSWTSWRPEKLHSLRNFIPFPFGQIFPEPAHLSKKAADFIVLLQEFFEIRKPLGWGAVCQITALKL